MSEENVLTKDIEQLGSLEERLHQATNEIDGIKSLFSKSTEDLSRIQSMLDIGNLNEITNLIGKFEEQISEAERKRDEAVHGAKKSVEELEKEKERLIKLWDAYKNQEEELSAAEAKLTSFEERAKNAEASKKQLEDDFNARIGTLTQKLEENENKVRQFDEYKQRLEEFSGIRNQLEEEVHSLKGEISKRDDTINSLQKEVNKAKEYEKYVEYKDKFDDISKQYGKEKERLTKLYHLYEETEAECNKLREETKGWQSWFDSNKQIFGKLFSAAPAVDQHVGSVNVMEETKKTSTPSMTPPPSTTNKKNKQPEPKRRLLRFKK